MLSTNPLARSAYLGNSYHILYKYLPNKGEGKIREIIFFSFFMELNVPQDGCRDCFRKAPYPWAFLIRPLVIITSFLMTRLFL
jgi:hypothetical protein